MLFSFLTLCYSPHYKISNKLSYAQKFICKNYGPKNLIIIFSNFIHLTPNILAFITSLSLQMHHINKCVSQVQVHYTPEKKKLQTCTHYT